MDVHSVSLKGRREGNEDKHNIILNEDSSKPEYLPVNYLAVYDGHGGKIVSRYLSQEMPNRLVKKGINFPLTKNFILNQFKGAQEELKTKHKNGVIHCGSTCLAAIHYKNQKDNKYYINVMNLGDCRAVICRDNLAIPITKDHKPHWPEERNRITQLGGNVYFDGDDYRIGDLSVSRAFGDVDAEPYVTHIPDIYKYRLEATDKFIILACDGLWDVCVNQEVVNFILTECYDPTLKNRINKNINIAKKLAEYAIQKGSMDNVTIIVAFL